MKKLLTNRLKRNFYGWILIGPFVLSLAAFFAFALARTFTYSFTQYDLFSPPVWVGINNYLQLFQDELFIKALTNTIAFSLIVTIVQTLLALSLAVLVNANIRGKGFFRTVFYIPSIMSSAAVTLIFVWFYQKNGFLNNFLSAINSYSLFIGLTLALTLINAIAMNLYARFKKQPSSTLDPFVLLVSFALALFVLGIMANFQLIQPYSSRVEISWLGTNDMVGPLPLTMWAIVIQNIFTTVPTLMLLFLAGLQGIPADYYEAARIDGANKLQQHLHITVPQLAPVTFVVITMGIIGTLQIFDQVALLGTGIPLESRITLAYYVYSYAFPDGSSPRVGIASAAALLLGLLTIVLVAIQNRLGVKER